MTTGDGTNGGGGGAGNAGRRAESPARILLVEDDDDYAAYLVYALRELGGHSVTRVADAGHALELIGAARWDIMVTDVNLPGASGLDLVRSLKEADPAARSVVITAYASVDTAVEALRTRTDEFLTKPVKPAQLLDVVARLTLLARAAERKRGRVLAIGAHPDDVEIGVGGILLAHRAAGDETAVLTMSHGGRGGEGEDRADEARRAAELLGADLYLRDLVDTAIDEGYPTVGLIEEVVAGFKPMTVYTHTICDTHQDHRNTSAATMVACRAVPSLYCYQSPSSTVDFRPTRFVGIDSQLDGKLAAIKAYASQYAIRDYLEPDLTTATARYWGRHGPGRYAESLEVIRERAHLGDAAEEPGSSSADWTEGAAGLDPAVLERAEREGPQVTPRPPDRPPVDSAAAGPTDGGRRE